MKYFRILDTDFYQISMAFMYILFGKNKENSGFEGFVRNIKKEVTDKPYYIFSGEKEVHEFMATIKKELEDPELIEAFIQLIEPKITNRSQKRQLIKQFRKNWVKINKNFTYNVVKEGSKVYPFVPVFQFYGDKAIGQLIETYVTNIYNGRTAYATLLEDNNITNEEKEYLSGIMNNNENILQEYKKELIIKAQSLRNSTDKVLLEAAFRRAPTKEIADMASTVAIENGWQGTSNVGIYMKNIAKAEQIGGTMAHAYVMSFPKEEDSWKQWDIVFPNTKILGDTYDTVEASIKIAKMIDNKEISIPKEFRIDSYPIEVLAKQVNENLSKYGIGNFLSGDMEESKFNSFKENNVPYTSTMVGTKFVYLNELIKKLNSGFVYKIVQYEIDVEDFDDKIDEWNELENDIPLKEYLNLNDYQYEEMVKGENVYFYPEKKASGKSNYRGLKRVIYCEKTNTLVIDYPKTKPMEFGFYNLDMIGDKNPTLEFREY